MKNKAKSLWAYRGFIAGGVKREFQSKYRNSLLGAAWTIINPLSMILVYTLIFSKIMRAKLPGIESGYAYSIYLCAGVLTWGFFTEIVSRFMTLFIDNGNLLKKLSFPKLCLPITVLANASLNFAIIFALFSVFLIVSGNFPGFIYFAIFPVLLTQILFSVGLGIILAVLNVFFRDVGQSMGIVLQFWFWFTPIVYPSSILPEKIKTLLLLNPMANIILAYQKILVEGKSPEWIGIIGVFVLSIFLCWFGFRFFQKHAGEVVDEL